MFVIEEYRFYKYKFPEFEIILYNLVAKFTINIILVENFN